MGSRHDIREAVDALPLDPVREALEGAEAWVVGGVVRDLVRGAAMLPDVDVAVDADLGPVLERLGERAPVEVRAHHPRFATATVRTGGLTIDLSRTRTESYAHPGALPEIAPAGIEADLARRDFSVNAMAVPLAGGDLVDPFAGASDLERSVLRVLHDASFEDDPTRAIRAARYASRLGLVPDERTRELLGRTDLTAVSADRRRAELARLAAEPTAPAGFRLLAEWGVLDPGEDALELIAAIDERAGLPPWDAGAAARADAILIAAGGGEGLRQAIGLAAAEPDRPSEAVRLAAGHAPAALLVAAAAGGGWLDDYVRRWREVRLEIDGDDLIAAGIPEGPAVGAGLRGAIERKLDGGLNGGREAELALALALARRSI